MPNMKRDELIRIEVIGDRVTTTFNPNTPGSGWVMNQLRPLLLSGRRARGRHADRRWHWKAETFPWIEVEQILSQLRRSEALLTIPPERFRPPRLEEPGLTLEDLI